MGGRENRRKDGEKENGQALHFENQIRGGPVYYALREVRGNGTKGQGRGDAVDKPSGIGRTSPFLRWSSTSWGGKRNNDFEARKPVNQKREAWQRGKKLQRDWLLPRRSRGCCRRYRI